MGWGWDDHRDPAQDESGGNWWEQLTGEAPWWLEQPRRAASPPPPPPKTAYIAGGDKADDSITPTTFLRYVCECPRCCRQPAAAATEPPACSCYCNQTPPSSVFCISNSSNT
jgi:hypothetical protein